MPIEDLTNPTITSATPLDALVRIADSKRYSDAARLSALIELGRRLDRPEPPPVTPRSVLNEVMNDERVPRELRTRAACALIQDPAEDSAPTQGERA